MAYVLIDALALHEICSFLDLTSILCLMQTCASIYAQRPAPSGHVVNMREVLRAFPDEWLTIATERAIWKTHSTAARRRHLICDVPVNYMKCVQIELCRGIGLRGADIWDSIDCRCVARLVGKDSLTAFDCSIFHVFHSNSSVYDLTVTFGFTPRDTPIIEMIGVSQSSSPFVRVDGRTFRYAQFTIDNPLRTRVYPTASIHIYLQFLAEGEYRSGVSIEYMFDLAHYHDTIHSVGGVWTV